jgi:hypothetical protein
MSDGDHDHDRAPGHHHEFVDAVVEGLDAAADGDLDDVDLDPALPELNIGDASVADWVKMTDDITRNRRFLVSSQNAVAF